MSRRNTKITEEKLKQMVKNGMGQGERENYKPFISVVSFASQGKSSIRYGYKVSRIMDYLSRNELIYYFGLDYCSNVVDIREQYPLLDEDKTQKETEQIAIQIGVKYPDEGEGYVHIMTTDFLITAIEDGQEVLHARTFKEVDKLSKRQLELFEIERIYWERRGVDFKIVTERELNSTFFANINFFYLQKIDVEKAVPWEKIVQAEMFFEKYLLYSDDNIIWDAHDMFRRLSEEEDFTMKECLTIFKFLVANKYWEIDLESRELAGLDNIEVLHIHSLPER